MPEDSNFEAKENMQGMVMLIGINGNNLQPILRKYKYPF
jgi:hypothetical protein